MSELPRQSAPRSPGDDVVVQVRVRRANLPALEAGFELGVDRWTGRPIVIRLDREEDGIYAMRMLGVNADTLGRTPDAVDAVEQEETDDG